jgi:hypothetical protein
MLDILKKGEFIMINLGDFSELEELEQISNKFEIEANEDIHLLEEIKCIPFFSETNVNLDMYNQLKKTREYIEENRSDTITGLWLLTIPTYDITPQILLRTVPMKSSIERLKLMREIEDFIKFDVIYDYDYDVKKPIYENSIENIEIIKWLFDKKFVAVYDLDRKDDTVDYVMETLAMSNGERDFIFTKCPNLKSALKLAKKDFYGENRRDDFPYYIEGVDIICDELQITFTKEKDANGIIGKVIIKISYRGDDFITETDDFQHLELGTEKEIKSRFMIK